MEEVMHGKPIAEVFPHLKLEGAMQEYLSPARVEHVAIDRKTHRLHVQLASSRWIHKKYIYRLEDEIVRTGVETCILREDVGEVVGFVSDLRYFHGQEV